MIHGIGIDSVHIDRMRKSIDRYGDRFARRILSLNEMEEYNQSQKAANYLAKHFAAKEAMAKALGTGFRDGLSLKHITVNHNKYGSPVIECSGRAYEMLKDNKIKSCYLSITDEKDYAFASVVLEKAAT